MNRHTLRDAAVGLVYIVVIAALVALSIAIYNKDFTDSVKVSLKTDSIGSALQKGSDVKVRGVPVGEVSSVTSSGQTATVHLQLTPSMAKQLPANMTAQLIPKTLFGERYVDLLFPTSPDGQHLTSGDTIKQDASPASVELQKLFADLLPVLQAVQPQKLAATLGELAAALRGRGTDLARTIHTVGSYLDQLAPHVPQLTDDLAAFATTAQTYADAAPSLVSGLASLTTTSQVIAARRTNYEQLLRSVTAMSKTVGSFLGTNRDQIIGLSRRSLPSLRITAKYSAEFPCLSRALVNYVPTANKAFGVGTSQVGAHVVLHIVPNSSDSSIPNLSPAAPGSAARCPYQPQTALAGTSLSFVKGATSPRAQAADGLSAADGLGAANSPQENQLIGELVASSSGLSATQYPQWASLLLGPALRGSQVTLK